MRESLWVFWEHKKYLARKLNYWLAKDRVMQVCVGIMLAALIYSWDLRVGFLALFLCIFFRRWWLALSIIASIYAVSLRVSYLLQLPSQNTVTMEASIVAEEHRTNFYRSYILSNPLLSGYLLYETEKYPDFRVGERIILNDPIITPIKTEETNNADYYLQRKIIGLISTDSKTVTKKIKNHTINVFLIKEYFKRSLYKNLPARSAGLSLGLLFGGKSLLDSGTSEQFRRSGISHIVAVSGFNVTIIILAVMYLLRSLPRRLGVILSGLCLIVYLYLVGLDNLPASRAAVMGGFVLGSMFLGFPTSYPRLLFLTVALFLLDNPLLIGSVSLWLSASAFLGLVLFTREYKGLLSFLPSGFVDLISGTLAATIATYPIIEIVFGEVSLVSLIANLVVLPLIPLVMGLTILGVGLTLIIPTLAALWLWPVYLFTTLILEVASELSRLEFASTSEMSAMVIYGVLLLVGLFLGHLKLLRMKGV